jgi:UDP-N-acetylmuramate--alanine ligase
MLNLNNIEQVYFIGIGGIGMSALARYFNQTGMEVAGYDRIETRLTRYLESQGMSIHYSDDVSLIPPFISGAQADKLLVVMTPAIPEDHKELIYFRDQGSQIFKRSEILGFISKMITTIAIGGTHGKTTISTLVAHIFNLSEVGCMAFMGGISRNYSTNLILNDRPAYMVVEADEFDRSFLRLSPSHAVVTSMDSDHLDIYGDQSSMIDSYHEFIQKIIPGGTLLIKEGLQVPAQLNENVELFRYHIEKPSDFYGQDIHIKDGQYHFRLVTPEGEIDGLHMRMPGRINVENAVAAASIAYLAGVDTGIIVEGINTYEGVERRFDVRIKSDLLTYIDDYAHHPKELDAFISSVKELFPGKKITGIFQPHLYSRTRDYAKEFAASLDRLDELFLLDIYPAREKPIEGVSSEMISEKMTLDRVEMCSRSNLLDRIRGRQFEVLLTLGAGDIDTMVEPIKKALIDEYGIE